MSWFFPWPLNSQGNASQEQQTNPITYPLYNPFFNEGQHATQMYQMTQTKVNSFPSPEKKLLPFAFLSFPQPFPKNQKKASQAHPSKARVFKRLILTPKSKIKAIKFEENKFKKLKFNPKLRITSCKFCLGEFLFCFPRDTSSSN